MLWLPLLIVVGVVVAAVAVSGVRPRGGRPVERTHLMTVARVVALVIIAAVAYAAWSGVGTR
jgi:hypothetical protein